MVFGPFHFKGYLGGPGIFISYAILKYYFSWEILPRRAPDGW